MVTTADQFGPQNDATPLKPEEFEVLLVSGGGEPGYSVFVPALPGCASEGDDWDEALYMIQGAIELFLEVAGRPPAEDVEDKKQLERDWTELGCLVEITTVWVNCDAGSDQ